jgi:hypothetical protein
LDGAFEGEAVRLRGRGNTTWWLAPDKRPLRLRFGAPVFLLGSEYAARDWILLSNHFDFSLMRNYAALKLSALLGGRMDFLPTARHVHLYVNDAYKGVYLLTDERDVHPSRVDIVFRDDPAESDYFLELDGRASEGGVYNETYFSVYNRLYDIRFPSGSRLTAGHVSYAREYIESVSEAIRLRRWDCIVSLVDLDSFVDFYILQELFKNSDAHAYSVFMTIRGQGEERRLYMGPPWDFDLAAGNRASQYSPQYLYVGIANYWYRNLMDMPDFFAAAAERWNELRDNEITQMIRLIGDTALFYRADFERNFSHYPILGTAFWITPPQMAVIDSFMGQVDYLIEWLNARVEWLDGFLNKKTDHDPLRHLVEQRTRDNPVFRLHNTRFMEAQALAEAFGLQAEYDALGLTIVFSRGDTILTHRIFDTEYTVKKQNDLSKGRFDASSFMAGGYAYIPIEPVLAVFGITEG